MLSVFQWWWGLVSASSSVIRLECPPSTDPASPSIPPRTGSTGSTCSPHLPSLIRVEHRRFLSLTACLKLHESSQSSWFVTHELGEEDAGRFSGSDEDEEEHQAGELQIQKTRFPAFTWHAAFKDVLVSSSVCWCKSSNLLWLVHLGDTGQRWALCNGGKLQEVLNLSSL